ncbi:MAG: hypothetical protein LBO66_01240 [Deltaproteobacteria bacterium]|nr:hypothetical protein [Deltaproteobacteria bacterium]
MHDKPPEDNISQAEALVQNKIIEMVVKIFEPYGNDLIEEHIREVLQIICAADATFLRGTSQADNFLSFADIEELVQEEMRCLYDASLRRLFNGMKRMVGEDSIVLKKKSELKENGIRVKRWRYYKNSIVTLSGRVFYERIALKASSIKDRTALKSLGYKGHVYPVDEMLGINSLPFDMTIAAMLKTTKEACIANSYEKAQIRLMESGININDDTIRAVINTVGGLVLDNEIKAANEAVLKFEKGLWQFPVNKKSGVLYFQIDGSMVHTRNAKETKENCKSETTEEPQLSSGLTILNQDTPVKKSSWRENKLGMAYSDDNIFWWTDKHGDKQRRILQKDYVSYIGEASFFSKLMLSLAVRNGYGHYQDTVLISDGATWIRELKNMYFPDAQQILDFWHLCENVSNFSKTVFAMDESKYKPWSSEICSLLKKSQTNEAIKKIKNLGSKRLSKSSFDLVQYIENNINNVDYVAYQAKGYFIGSGAIEGSNKSVVQSRMKLSGMRWDLEAAQKMICLLTKLNSGRWEEDVVKVVYQHYDITPGKQYNLRFSEKEEGLEAPCTGEHNIVSI